MDEADSMLGRSSTTSSFRRNGWRAILVSLHHHRSGSGCGIE